MAQTTARLQEAPFNASNEYHRFCQASDAAEGAVVMFTGKVRAQNKNDMIIALTIEHYPKMTEKLLARLVEHCAEKFSLTRAAIIHRIGRINQGETIVMVLTAAAHRKPAFEANQEIVEQLKSEIPLWKKEHGAESAYWIKPPTAD